MKIPETLAHCSSQGLNGVSRRRSFLSFASMAGIIALAPVSAAAYDRDEQEHGHKHEDEDADDGKLRRNDFNILIAAEIAEALAVTTYSNIILQQYHRYRALLHSTGNRRSRLSARCARGRDVTLSA
jgi:hypothetical protein